MDQILSDLRVVDLAVGIPGPVAAMIFAEMGAEVLKIEAPERGVEAEPAGLAVWNRSKKSVVLDLGADLERLHELLSGSDVLFHSYTQSQASAYGLDDKSLQERHPHLIACAITGFPAGHAAEETPPNDTLVNAEMGLLDEQAAVRREGPVYLRLPLGSWHAASLAAIGVLARLIYRDRGGQAGPAHTSLLQGALVPMSMYWQRAERPTEMLAWGLPKRMQVSIFACGDGLYLHVMMSCHQVPWMKAEFERRGEAWVAAADAAAGVDFRIPFPHFGAVREILKSRPRHEWLEHFWAHDVPVQPVLEMGQILLDEQASVNGYVVEVDDAYLGPTKQPGLPFSITPLQRAPSPRPVHGTDTAAVLADLPASRNFAPRAPGAGAPLDGLKVLDLGAALAGPLGPMLLADLGADVIKVEPLEGDMMRVLESNFCGCQRGKRSIVLPLKDPASKEVLARLVKWADVVHHNLRMPAALKLGIDYPTLAKINPNIVYCHVSSYGPQGARRDWPGMDQMFQSSCGWEMAGAGRDNPPIWHRFGFTDHLCALASLQATLMALRRRDATGEGQMVTASLLGATILTTSEAVMLADGQLTPFPEIDALQLGLSPFERLYAASDGWVAISEPNPARQHALLTALGVEQPAACEAALAALTQSEALNVMRSAAVACAPVRVNQKAAFLDSPENRKIGLRAVYEHKIYGEFEQPGAFWHFGDLKVRLDRPPPVLGQHSAEIFKDLGYDDSEISALLQQWKPRVAA